MIKDFKAALDGLFVIIYQACVKLSKSYFDN
jgi:hypothetical protein